jgi:hypothetical protein
VLDWVENEIYIPAKGNPKIKCLNGFDVTVKNKGEYLAISVPFENRQDVDTIIECTYNEKVADIFTEVINYDDICAKTVYKDESVILENL